MGHSPPEDIPQNATQRSQCKSEKIEQGQKNVKRLNFASERLLWRQRYHTYTALDFPVSLGQHRFLSNPEEPGKEEEKPWVIGRKPFGKIAIANSDAGASANTDVAIDQAWRAVRELLAITNKDQETRTR